MKLLTQAHHTNTWP